MYLFYNGIYADGMFNVVNEWQQQFILATACEAFDFGSHGDVQRMTYAALLVSHGSCGVLW